MRGAACSQAWKSEALRDGRIAGTEALEFRRHAAACEICSEMTRRLDGLAAMLSMLPLAPTDPRRVRDDRQRLLEAADAVATGRERRSIGGRVAVACTLFAAAAAIVVVGLRSIHPRVFVTNQPGPFAVVAPLGPSNETPPGSVAALPTPAPDPSVPLRPFSATVTHDAGARWTRHEDAREVRILLDEGMIAIAVAHGQGDKHVTFKVPDGEIEDLGTAFSVSVERGRTTKVAVTEGSVALHLRGHATVRLGRGESWERHVPWGDRAARARVRRDPRAGSPSEVASSEAAAPTEESTAPPDPAPPAGCVEQGQWDEAMRDFQANRYAAAAERFGRFAANCAQDRRAEDATYLRVVALARAGRHDEARAAAQAYLNRFPRGFRRQESERFLRSAPPTPSP
jgi:hypothetical protein